MKTKNILYLVIGLLLVGAFFFKIIPIPIESVDGYLDKEHFIYGGMYYTSILNELNVGNYAGSLSFLSLFGVLIFTNNYYNGGKDGNN